VSDTSGDTVRRAFIYDSTNGMQDLGSLAGTGSQALGINNSDEVVGLSSYLDTSGNVFCCHAFLYDGTMHDLGTLGGCCSLARAINSSDQVVGESTTSDPNAVNPHAFLYSDGVMKDLNSLIAKKSGWELVQAEAINDNGYIVGNGINKRGLERAFLLVPTQ
jgi:probable HAF family extracellular repeat protein